MRNLSIVSIFVNKYEEKNFPSCFCFSNDVLYALVDDEIVSISRNEDRHVFNFRKFLEENSITLRPVYMDATSNPGQLVLCSAEGELLTIEPENNSVELVGCIAPGVAAAAWSPIGDVFAVITISHNAVLLNQDLEPVTEVELHESGKEQPISVGWGKKETQFRGSEGKLKDEKAQEIGLVRDDHRCRISWRDDGDCFVVSFFEGNVRHLRVIGNDGTLLYNCEPVVGLESALCWRPLGSFIASTQVFPNKRMVCFFEKNLLPHGGFEIKESEIVDELLWNHDSTILAVVLKTDFRIKLYSVGNWSCWYHKFTISTDGEKPVFVKWDESDGCMLHVITHSTNVFKHYRYAWRWSVDCSNGRSHNDLSWVAVIDGLRLLLTGFKKEIIPPPMSSTVLELSSPINSIGFLQLGAENANISSNCLFIYCVDGSLSTYHYDKELNFIKTSSGMVSDCLTQPAWVAENKIIAASVNQHGNQDLVLINLPSFDISRYPSDTLITTIKRIPNEESVLLWDQTNWKILNLFDFKISDCSLPTARVTSRLISVEIREKIFTLDSSHRMNIGSETIATNVTSFCVLNTHLLMTTLQHKLLLYPLCERVIEMTERPVERGSRLITAVPGTSRVILQAPRGNLEVVLPRALTIETIKRLLDDLKYLEAFKEMRRERINFNLIHDHNPKKFMENLTTFLDEISDPMYLCQFIAELVEDNVTQTLYLPFYAKVENQLPKDVNLVCTLLLSGMECRADREKNLLPIISCFIKKGDTEEAIILVRSILSDEKRGIRHEVSSSEGLTHILYLIHIELLFKIALGTYDLSLVMFIASQSQKDPKEYLPFLSNLQQMEENYQKFTIDNFLKRYKKALAHLALCPDRVKECLNFVEKHDLYREALRLFAQDSDTWKAVCVSYGAQLTRQSRHEEAGLLLQRAGEYLLARHAFSRAGAWRQELFCAEALNIPEDEKSVLFKAMVENLLAARRYTEAAALCLEHIGDVEAGIDALCSAHQHDEAMRVAWLHKRNDLIGNLIKPSALLVRDTYEQTINEAKDNFDRHLNRLRIVRQIQEDNPQDWDDTGSESSRGSSRATSTRSAKNARKLERNLMKQGGVFEKDALIAALHDVVSQTTALKSQVRALNLALVALNEHAAAVKLQNIFKHFLEYIEPGVREIWPPPSSNSDHAPTSNSIAAEFGAIKRQLPAPVQALQPKVLFPPDQSNRVEWQLDILHD